MEQVDQEFALLLRHRKDMSAVCSDIKSFCDGFRWVPPSPFPPSSKHERLLSASLDGLIKREISLFGSITILERSKKMDDVFILCRTLFEVGVDAAVFASQFENKSLELLDRISYAWHTNLHNLFKESPNLTREQLEQVQSRIKKVPGLSEDDHTKIKKQQHFSGKNVRARCIDIDIGKFYKPMYAGLSRYTHGMTFDREIAVSKGQNPHVGYKARVAEEALVLVYSAIILLEHIQAFKPIVGIIYSDEIRTALLDRTTALVDAMEDWRSKKS